MSINNQKTIALIGNPNVGKSTIFNSLTGLNQHTGNWAGKTVGITTGKYKYQNQLYNVIDLPGITCLNFNSAEEEVTFDFIKNHHFDLIVFVADATILERSIRLLLQIIQITNKVLVTINLTDLAENKNIIINYSKLSDILGININKTAGVKRKYIQQLKSQIFQTIDQNITIPYKLPKLDEDNSIEQESKRIFQEVVKDERNIFKSFDYRLDKILTGKKFGIPIMLLLLLFTFYLTIIFSNYPSKGLFLLFNIIQNHLLSFANFINCPLFLSNLLILGAYNTLSWVIAVMLPPMAIFFFLFSFLEDFGYLPRIAFNLDGSFKRCSGCGKQALTMCMSFGCNSVGITGTKIIDSPKERLIAILTNNFIPCNGRFPMMIVIISIFLGSSSNSLFNSLIAAGILTLLILLSLIFTMITSKILAITILKQEKSFFVLELPPYRKPYLSKIIKQSIFNKALVGLSRAIIVALPAGILIFLIASINLPSKSLIQTIVDILNPLGNLMGLDGSILLGFILGFPANEIVIPSIIMIYSNNSHLIDLDSKSLFELLIINGWSIKTAIIFLIFAVFHWPCSTTLITIKKETSSYKWTFIAFIIPTLVGILLSILVNFIFLIF